MKIFYYKLGIYLAIWQTHVINACAAKVITQSYDIKYCTNHCKFQQSNTKLKNQNKIEELKV